MHANCDIGVLADPDPIGSLDESHKAEIRQELDQILASHAFCRTERSKHFLSFVVGRALEGHCEELKERIIGIALFRRSPTYGTADDSIVRVSASQVRRRLAQYYAESAQDPPVRIELPIGSYAPSFHWRSPEPEPVVKEEKKYRRWQTPAILILVLGLGLAVFLLGRTFSSHVLKDPPKKSPILVRFWDPVLSSSRPVMVCLLSPTVFGVSSQVSSRNVFRQLAESDQRARKAISMLPGSIPRRDILVFRNHYVSNGDARSAADLSALFSGMGKAWEMRIDPNLTFADLRDSPAVLVGAFTNALWSMQTTLGMEFVFVGGGTAHKIKERGVTRRVWASSLGPSGRVLVDYALISRILLSKTGQPLVLIGGLTWYGTEAAGELTTNNEELATALENAPKQWENENLQLVIETRIIGSTPEPPHVIAAHFWSPQ